MAKDPVKYGTIREAYCARYRCRSARFEWHVMWRCFPLFAMPFIWLFWCIERSFFQKDFEATKAAGAARNSRELESVVEEFENLMGVDRGFRRGTLHLRITGQRLARRLEPMLDMLVSEETPSESDTTLRASPQPESREGGSVVLRRVRKVRDDMVQGRPLAAALQEAGLTQSDLRSHVEALAASRPDLVWFSQHLSQMEEFSRIREENDRLTRLTAELSARLLQLDAPSPTASSPTSPPRANY